MSKTAYEIETELGGSGENRTGFGGRPELINFYIESASNLSALPVLDQMTVDALRCGKIIPVVTIAGETPITTLAYTVSTDTTVSFVVGENTYTYTIATQTWAKS